MPTTVTSQANVYRDRLSFAKLPEVMDIPNLISIQVDSLQQSDDRGPRRRPLLACLPSRTARRPSASSSAQHEFGDPKHSVEECKKQRHLVSGAALRRDPLHQHVRPARCKEQDVFMGDFPLMTTARHLHHQRHRARRCLPARAFARACTSPPSVTRRPIKHHLQCEGHPHPRRLARVRDRQARRAFRPHRPQAQAAGHVATCAPSAWPRPARRSSTSLATARWSQRTLETRPRHPRARKSRSSSSTRRLRPGEPPTVDSARSLLEGLFFNPQRYDLAKVGRYKIDKKLGSSESDSSTLTGRGHRHRDALHHQPRTTA